MNLKYLTTFIVAATLCLPVFSANTVLLQTPVTYDPNAGVVQQVRDECKIEDMLATRVSAILARRNRSGTGVVDVGVGAQSGGTLKLTITHVLGVGGGAWSGPKAITIKAELFEGQVLQRQQKINRWSVGGMWGAFKGTCSILDRVAIQLAKDLGRWSFDPNFKPREDEPMPNEGDSTAPPATETNENEVRAEGA